jgi:hypothetical protein
LLRLFFGTNSLPPRFAVVRGSHEGGPQEEFLEVTTRHERRKRAKLRLAARERRERVIANLSAPADRFVPRGTLISPIYAGEIGRARGTGVTPMTHKVQAVIARDPVRARLLYPAGTKIIRER